MIAAAKHLEEEPGPKMGPAKLGEAKTVYAWKSKCRGMGASDAQEARRLREGNSRLREPLPNGERPAPRGGSKTLRIPGVSLRMLLWLFRAH